MIIKEVTVGYKKTIQLKQFEPITASISVTAAVQDGEDMSGVVGLQMLCKDRVHDQINADIRERY